MEANSQSGQKLLNSALSAVKTALNRIALHLVAIVSALAVSGLDMPEGIYAYSGIICLIPGGMELKEPRYSAPFACAILFLCVNLLYGLNFSVALLWSGALNLLVRAIIERLKLGFSWSALPLLLICTATSFNAYRFPLLTFAICAVLGPVTYVTASLLANKIHLDRALRKITGLLEPALKRTAFPEDFKQQLSELNQQCATFYRADLRHKNKQAPLLLPALEALQPDLLEAVKWPAEKFKGSEANALMASVDDLNTLLEHALNENKAIAVQPTQVMAPDDEFAEFQAYADLLKSKKSGLPPGMHRHIDALFLSTQSILSCMREDPEDKPAGSRFLERFLPAAHKIIDEYIRLSAEGTSHESTSANLAQTESLLERMAEAFHEEHGNLLRNDAMRFNADIQVLDTLLKMSGH